MRLLAALLLALALPAAAGDAATPVLVARTEIATPGADLAEGVAISGDGSIYVAGNAGAPLGDPPDGAAVRRLGSPIDGWTYGPAFVARYGPDGRRMLARLELAPGTAKLTTVEVGPAGVYVGGYASHGLAPLIRGLGGLFPEPHGYAQRSLQCYCPGEHHSEPRRDLANDQRGVPFVLRLDADLSQIECGTYLEGWQSVWHVPRPLREDHWQPVAIGLLSGGDLVVCHDGGYNRSPEPGQAAGFEHFYGVPDHLSRLSPNLSARAWRREIYTPPTDPEKVDRYQPNFGRSAWSGHWQRPDLGNTRVLRLRVGPGDVFYAAGWSPTRTSREPWWSPFLWKYDAGGNLLWRAYNPDPMSGTNDRMGTLVSDAGLRSVAVDPRGNVLAALIGDGGNSVLRQDPRDYTRPAPNLRGGVHSFPGRVLFWGAVVRLDAETRELLGGNHVTGFADGDLRRAWAKDLAAAPGGRVLAVGRHTGGFQFTEDAWNTGAGAFLRVYGPDFGLEFSTAVADFNPATLAARGSRAAIVGRTDPPRPARGQAPAATDAVLMVVDVRAPDAPGGQARRAD